jgi:hypothetical protein
MPSNAQLKHVFVSYVSENSDRVDDLCAILDAANIPYWRDRSKLGPGDQWKVKIREAILSGSMIFLACFSEQSRAKVNSYMNKELKLAIEAGRMLPPDSTWIIPVRLDDVQVPKRKLRPGLTLRGLNNSDLFGDRHAPDLFLLVDKLKELMGLPAGTDRAVVHAVAKMIAAKEQLEARAAARREMGYTLAPILRRIANGAVENPAILPGEVTRMVVNAAARLIGPIMATRSCFYRLENGPPKRLVLEEHAGRQSPPGRQFAAGYPRGDAAIALVEDDQYLLCEDVDTAPPPNWSPDNDLTYKTFISVGVRTSASEWGMLTVDTPTPGDLTELDVDFLRVLGGLIAAAMSIASAAGPVGGQQ